jgi:tight adherence protein B
MTKRVILSIVIVMTALLGAGSASAERSLRVVSADAPFPTRSLVVSLSGGAVLRPGGITVRENGNDVRGVTILPADGAGENRFGTVLVLDASNSMRGVPIRSAMKAARAFAARRNPGQPLAIITFNDSAKVVTRLTTNGAAIDAALATLPKLGEGTHIHDAVLRATTLLRKAHVSPGSIVLLTDGKDTGSRASLDVAVRGVTANRVRVFSVGLRSKTFDATSLETLARETGGSYSEATSAQSLEKIYDGLGLRLAHEYLVTYRSLAPLGATVHVSVYVAGIHSPGETLYVAPSLPKERGGTFHRSVAYRLWRSPISMLLVALLVAGLVAAATMLLLRPPSRTLRRRMSEFVSLVKPEQPESTPRPSANLFRHAEKPLERSRWWTQFQEELEIAEVKMPAVQIVLWTVVATVVFMWLIAAVTTGIFAVFALAIPWGVRSLLKRKLRKRREAFSEQLPDNLQVLASGLRAGHSIVGALSLVVEESDEPSRSEFRRVIADEQLGVPLEDAIDAVVRRMDNHDLEQVALVAALQRRTGGSAAEVLDRVTETIRERFELRRLVKGLTAQGRLSRWIVSLLPPALMAVISLINPHYLDPLFKTSGGRLLLLLGTCMVVAGSVVIKKIVEIKI